jgi:hypothetical protein
VAKAAEAKAEAKKAKAEAQEAILLFAWAGVARGVQQARGPTTHATQREVIGSQSLGGICFLWKETVGMNGRFRGFCIYQYAKMTIDRIYDVRNRIWIQ